MKNEHLESRAYERFQIIAPLLDNTLDKSAEIAARKRIAKEFHLSERTLRRWVNDFNAHGLAGLMPAQRTPAENSVVTTEILNEAIHLRRELPKRSVRNIIKSMEAKGIVAEGELKRSTLQDALSKAGYSSAQMRLYEEEGGGGTAAHRFQKAHRNDCWQMDIKYGPRVNGAATYLFTVIDDATRYVCYSGFFPRQDLEATMTALRSAFQNAGIPKVLYLDNGKVFRSRQIQRVASVLGIRLTYIRPYTPRGHGKIERYNGTVDGFLLEASLEKIESIEKLNHLYEAWLDDCYLHEAHAGLDGKTPKEAFDSDPEPIQMAEEDKLHDAFLQVETRKVNRTGCISLFNQQWEIANGSLLIGRRVQVLIDPMEPEVVTIECEGFPDSTARRLLIGPHTSKRSRTNKSAGPTTSGGSALLRGAVQHMEERREQERTDVLRFSDLRKDND